MIKKYGDAIDSLLDVYGIEFDLDELQDEELNEKLLYEAMLNDTVFFDEEISEAIKSNDPFWLNEYLGIALEKASEICEELRLRNKISLKNLKIIMFARDRKALDIKIEKVTTVDLTSEELDDELDFFNQGMLERNNSAVKVEGKNSEGRRVVLYYYPGSFIKDQYNIHRQIKVYNEFDDVEVFQEQIAFSHGVIGDPTTALVAYRYDENGNKKFALYDDEVYGGRYFEYDENGKMVYLITETNMKQISKEMLINLMRAFNVRKPYFEDMDNSLLKERLDLFSGNEHKKVNNKEREYNAR